MTPDCDCACASLLLLLLGPHGQRRGGGDQGAGGGAGRGGGARDRADGARVGDTWVRRCQGRGIYEYLRTSVRSVGVIVGRIGVVEGEGVVVVVVAVVAVVAIRGLVPVVPLPAAVPAPVLLSLTRSSGGRLVISKQS